MAGFFDDTEDTTSPVVKSFFDDTETEQVNAVNPNTPDFKQGIQRGLQNLQASAYGATALAGKGLKELGAESAGQSVQDFGLEGYKRNIEEAKQYPAKYSFKDVYTGEAGVGGTIDYVQGTLGELVPSMLEAGVGALVGSAVAPGVGTGAGALAGRTVLKKGIEKATEQALKRGVGELAEDQIKKQVTGQALKKLGAKAGIGAAVMPVESGGMYGELLAEKGIDAPGTAMLFGSLATALEFAGGNSKLVDTLVDAIGKGAAGTIKKSAKELLTNIPQEAMQEGSQEALSILNTVVNTDEKFLTARNIERIVESMAAGAVGGGAGAGVNAIFSGQAKDQKLRTDEEIALDNQASNILALDKDQFTAGTKKLSDELKANQELLSDVKKFDAKVVELGIDPKELTAKLIYDNKTNQALLDKVNAGIKAKEDLAKKEYEKLSPEEKVIKDTENRFNTQREANLKSLTDEAYKVRDRLNVIDNIEKTFGNLYANTTDPAKKKQLADYVFNLNKEKNKLRDRQLDLVENKTLAPYTTREERQKYLNDIFSTNDPDGQVGTVNVGDKVGIEKDAAESAQTFVNNADKQEEMLQQILQEKDIQKKRELQDNYNQIFQTFQKDAADSAQTFQTQDLSQFDQIVKAKDKDRLNKVLENIVIEPDPQVRQTLYENMFMLPGVKDAAASAEMFASQGEQDITARRRQDLQRTMNAITKESDPVVRQKLYNQMFEQPGIKNAQESAAVFEGKVNELDQREAARKQAAGEQFYTQLFAEEKRPFNVDAFNEVTNKSAEQSAAAFEKAGMGKGQASSFTDERQVPLTDQQQILVDKNNFEIAKLTEKWNKSVDRDERIDALNKIDVLEKDNALIRTSVEQFDTFEELGNDPANAWYSALENAVNGFQQNQATPDQWKGMIKNYPGIKQEELDWIGLNEWLDKQEGKVSKDSLMNFIQENNVQLEEVIRGDGINTLSPQIQSLLKKENISADYDSYIDEYYFSDSSGNKLEFNELSKEIQDAIYNDYPEKRVVKYYEYQLPGGKNYKEILLTLPAKENIWNEEYKKLWHKMEEKYGTKDYFQLEKKLTEEDNAQLDYLDKKAKEFSNSVYYQSSHWQESNILAHIRFDERTDSEGNKVLFINEVQSDWHQEGRKIGYQKKDQPIETYDALKEIESRYPNVDFESAIMGYPDALTLEEQGVSSEDIENYYKFSDDFQDTPDPNEFTIPDAPFKKTWPLLAMKRMIRYAAENGFDKISWPSSLEQIAQIEGWGKIEVKETDQGKSYFINGQKNVSSIVNRYLVDLPRMLNSEFNRGKWGNAKVAQINLIQEVYNPLTEKYYPYGDKQEQVFSLPITERMKAKALNEGMPMFELSNGESYNPSSNVKQEATLGNILEAVKSAEGLTGQLANFISDFLPSSKLYIKVIIDPSVKSASYIGGTVNTITLRDPAQLTSSIHEITHAVTAREMIANPAIRDQVKLLMERVKLKAIKEAILTPAQAELLATERTSFGYKENLKGNFKYDNVAYGLLNEFEFLAQAMGNSQFQELLKATTIADKGVLRNAWDAFVELVMKTLGIQGIHKNAFGETLSIIAKLASQENVNQVNQTANESYESLDVEQRLPQSEYDAVFAEKNNLLKNIVQQAGIKYHEVKLLTDKALGSISTRLKKVDPELSEHLRWLDFKTSQKIIDVLKTAKPLLDATKGMSPEDKSEWNWARLNSDEGKIARIESKYNLTDQVKLLREKLNQIRDEAIAVGYDVGFIEEYWPRVIKDTEGFLQATQGISQRAEFTEAIRAEAKKLGITQKQFERDFPEVKADIISNMILGRHYGIGGPGNIKARVFKNIDPKYAKFYMDADASLMQYVYSMTKKIEARKFFGKVPERISDLKSSSKRKNAELIKLTQLADMARAENPEKLAEYQDRITEINEDLARIDQSLNLYKSQNDYTENIGAYIDEMRVAGRITHKDEKTVKDILTARFNEHGTTGVVNAFKNAAYIDVMANPASAITQIGDLAWAMYVGKVWTPSGFLGTARNLGKAVAGKSDITKEDLGFERIAQEFADGTTLGKAVSKAFKLVGLEKVDTIGKEVLINNALDQYKAEAKANPEALAKKIKPTFGSKSLDVVQEILADVPSDNVKMLLYSKVLDFQPAALSEMPEFYLKAGNGRVAYMLKTYTIKQFDVFRREVIHNLKADNPQQKIQGLTNMVQLLALLTLANASADELKDWMLGKETRFADNVIENLLTMGGASRFTRMQVSKEGFGSAMLQQILPPMKFINSASKDLAEGYDNYVSGDTSSFDHARIIDSIPGVGKLYYWHYGRGEENKKSLAEKDFSEATKAADLFKKQLENSTDKRTFIEANLDKFKQMKLQENFQAALNRNKAVINKLEKLPSTENVQTRLGQLKSQREQILKKYLEVAETLN